MTERPEVTPRGAASDPSAGPRLAPTPGQTVGPFFGYALPFQGDNELVAPGSDGAIVLHGVVTDGHGQPVPDALLELWQVDADGEVVQETGALGRGLGRAGAFTGWGRASTDDEGHYAFTTLLPAAPFFALTIFARGLPNRLFTRAYLPGADDSFLAGLEADRRETLVARADEGGLMFDVRLQGEGETVFLRYPRH